MHIFWWILPLISTWGALFFASDAQRFRWFWTGGLWSVGLAMLGEGLIRSDIGYFIPERLVFPFLGTDFLNFIGPRFVEGVLFMQTLRPTRKLLQASLWVTTIVVSEMLLALTGQIDLSWGGIGLALAVHSLRFLSLLGIHDALDYAMLGSQPLSDEHEDPEAAQVPMMNRTVWVYSWPLFGLGSVLVLKATRGLDKLVSRQG